jgi:chromosome segregation ATPase
MLTRRRVLDTEAIASEIVSIRNRLEKLDEQMEEGESEVADERASLMDRLRHLQNRLASNDPTDSPAEPEHVHYLPPA